MASPRWDSRVPIVLTKWVRSETGIPRAGVPANGLAADTKALQDCLVALGIRVTKVRQKAATLGYQGQQSPAGPVILFVRLEVLRKQADSAAQ